MAAVRFATAIGLSLLLVAMGWRVAMAQEAGVQIRPLAHDVQLEPGQKKRGVVDIANPSEKMVKLDLSVQAFRQVGNDGQLEFYNDDQINQGITLDQTDIELAGKSAYRLVFEVDGNRLPEGDVFAAIFASSQADKGMVAQSASVGALLFIANGDPGPRSVELESAAIPWIVTSGRLEVDYVLRNPAEDASGFRPKINLAVAPLDDQVNQLGRLIMAGNQRSDQIVLESNRIGLYRVTLHAEDASRAAWVVFMPFWLILASAGLIITGLIAWRLRAKKLEFNSSK